MTTVRRTRRWRGVVAVALFVGAIGLFLKRPSLLLAATVGVAFAVHPRLWSTPAVSLDVAREVAPEDPRDGEAVTVTTTLCNDGEETLADLRVVDGVPPMLEVVSGTPRHTAVLRPGETTTFSYDVTARPGIHRFEPTTVLARDLSGGTEVETTVPTETTLEWLADVPATPLRAQTDPYAGDLLTDQGGAGIEFHETREYRQGDPLNRIDWRRFARTGELTTVTFREERLASVVVCVDAREPAYRTDDEETPHAVWSGVAAAEQLVTALAATPNRVGVAAIGRELCWLAPSAATDQDRRARTLLADHPTVAARRPTEEAGTESVESQVRELRQRLDATTQVLFVTPLTDAFVTETVLTLEASGHAVTVLSPDVTTTDTVGGAFGTVERAHRIASLRGAGVRVVDWDREDRVGSALVRARRRWSA